MQLDDSPRRDLMRLYDHGRRGCRVDLHVGKSKATSRRRRNRDARYGPHANGGRRRCWKEQIVRGSLSIRGRAAETIVERFQTNPSRLGSLEGALIAAAADG